MPFMQGPFENFNKWNQATQKIDEKKVQVTFVRILNLRQVLKVLHICMLKKVICSKQSLK